jgi:hypothetical protein
MQRITRPTPRSVISADTSPDASLADGGSAPGGSTGTELAALGVHEYRPALAAADLISEIRGLLATEGRAERLVCRYLADLADRIQARRDAELAGYADEFDAARHCFGLGARDVRERVRMGRALRNLPRIEQAFVDGELCYSRVREVTRVATVGTEPDWLELARRLDMRSLERRVAAQRDAGGAEPSRYDKRRLGQPARTEWMGPEMVRVTFELSMEAWTLIEQAMREARRAGAAGPSDGNALEAVARAALSVPRADTCDAGDGFVPYQGPSWGGDEARARAGAVESALSIADARGIAERDATQGGSAERAPGPRATAHEFAMAATQGGSAERAPGTGDRRSDDEHSGSGFVDQASEPVMRLMRVMGRSGGWTLEALTESSGLSVQEACVALTLLELGGRVRRRAFAFDPV